MLGEFFKNIRLEKKISVDSIRSKLGVSEDYVKFLEEGSIFSFSKERRNDIINAYALTEDEKKEFFKLIKL